MSEEAKGISSVGIDDDNLENDLKPKSNDWKD